MTRHESRYAAVLGRRRDAGLALLDLEPAQVIRARRIGATSQERRKPPDVADVVALRLSREPAHGHVVDQPPTKRADGGVERRLGHRQGSLLEEPRCSARGRDRSTQARPPRVYPTLNASAPPAERVRSSARSGPGLNRWPDLTFGLDRTRMVGHGRTSN